MRERDARRKKHEHSKYYTERTFSERIHARSSAGGVPTNARINWICSRSARTTRDTRTHRALADIRITHKDIIISTAVTSTCTVHKLAKCQFVFHVYPLRFRVHTSACPSGKTHREMVLRVEARFSNTRMLMRVNELMDCAN